MKAAEIRERFLSFFEERGHRRMPSASLVPSSYDPTVLLTTAGMQPFKPYFRGEEEPPARRLTSCQKSFRTTDIENVGLTTPPPHLLRDARQLLDRGLLQAARPWSSRSSCPLRPTGFGFDPERIWITVFGGDEELGLGPGQRGDRVLAGGGRARRADRAAGHEDNFWQSGPTGPCGPCSELYYDRGPEFGAEATGRATTPSASWSSGTSCSCSTSCRPTARSPSCRTKNIDTGMGLDRCRRSSRTSTSVFETALFRPLIELGEELSGRRYGEDPRPRARCASSPTTAGRRPSCWPTGWCPPTRTGLHPAPDHAPDDPAGARAGHRGPSWRASTGGWWTARATPIPSCARLAHDRALGARRGGELRAHAQAGRAAAGRTGARPGGQTSWVSAEDAFKLHDTYGFPYEMTKELLAEEGLSVDDQGFEELMERAREVSRAGGSGRLKAAADAGGGHRR